MYSHEETYQNHLCSTAAYHYWYRRSSSPLPGVYSGPTAGARVNRRMFVRLGASMEIGGVSPYRVNGIPAFGLAMTDGDIFLNIVRITETRLIRTNRAIHAHLHLHLQPPGNNSLDSISPAENISVCVYRHGTHNRQLANCEAVSTAARSSILIMVSATIRSTPESFRIPICSDTFQSCLIGSQEPSFYHWWYISGSNVNLMVCRISDFS